MNNVSKLLSEVQDLGLHQDITISNINIMMIIITMIVIMLQEMKENMALQSQAKKWLQVVKIDGLI